MKTADEIIEQFRIPCGSIFLSKYGSEGDLMEVMKACAILYVDGQIEVVQQFPVSIHVENMLKKLEKLKQEIY